MSDDDNKCGADWSLINHLRATAYSTHHAESLITTRNNHDSLRALLATAVAERDCERQLHKETSAAYRNAKSALATATARATKAEKERDFQLSCALHQQARAEVAEKDLDGAALRSLSSYAAEVNAIAERDLLEMERAAVHRDRGRETMRADAAEADRIVLGVQLDGAHSQTKEAVRRWQASEARNAALTTVIEKGDADYENDTAKLVAERDAARAARDTEREVFRERCEQHKRDLAVIAKHERDQAAAAERERIAAWLEGYDKDSTRLANIAEAIRVGCHEEKP